MVDSDTAGGWPPNSNGMPDLSGLEQNLMLKLTLNAAFQRAGPTDRFAWALWTNYVRLVDQVVREYTGGRDSLQQYIDTPNTVLGPLFRCIGHMETCISTMRRAILFACRMRRHRQSPHIEKLPLLSGSAERSLRDLRNAIEHLEEKILDGQIDEGDPRTLLVGSDAVVLAGHEISHRDLADWITQLHSLSKHLADYHQPDAGT